MATFPLSWLLRPDVLTQLTELRETTTARRWTTELGEETTAAAWLPDHQAVVLLTATGQLVCLSAVDGQPTWNTAAPSDGAACLGVCPTAPLVATGHVDGKLCLRDATTGKPVREHLLGPHPVACLGWAPNGQLLAASCGPDLHVLDNTGQPLAHYHGSGTNVAALCWRPDSGALAVTSGPVVQLFPVPSRLRELVPYQTLTEDAPLLAVAWSPTGHHLVAGLPAGCLSSWQMSHWLLPKPLRRRQGQVSGSEEPMNRLSWHHEGGWLASAHGSGVAIWRNAAIGLLQRPKCQLPHPSPVQQVAFQHQGNILATTVADGTLTLWSPLEQSTPLLTHLLGSGISALSWAPNDQFLAVSTSSGRVVVLSVVS